MFSGEFIVGTDNGRAITALDTHRLDRLEAFGIGDVFTVPGEQVMDAVDAGECYVQGVGLLLASGSPLLE